MWGEAASPPHRPALDTGDMLCVHVVGVVPEIADLEVYCEVEQGLYVACTTSRRNSIAQGRGRHTSMVGARALARGRVVQGGCGDFQYFERSSKP